MYIIKKVVHGQTGFLRDLEKNSRYRDFFFFKRFINFGIQISLITVGKKLIFAHLYINIIKRKMSKKIATYHFNKINEFDWDKGNIDKNEINHDVKWLECEQIFFNRPLLFSKDTSHSITEERYYAYGMTDTGRLLTIVFTIRENKIRVISAREMSEKERKNYEKYEKV